MAYPGDQRSQFITPALSEPLANMYTPNYGGIQPAVPNVPGTNFSNSYVKTADMFGPNNLYSSNSNLYGGNLSGANLNAPTNWMDSIGKYGPSNWTLEGIGTAAKLGVGAGNLLLGFKQYGLAKKQLKHARNSFNKNYAAQRQITNANLRDRQEARVASNPTPGVYQSVGDYMRQNQVAA